MVNGSQTFTQAVYELAKGSQLSDIVAIVAKKIEKFIIITDATNRIVAHYDPLVTGLEIDEFFKLHPRKIDKNNKGATNKTVYEGEWDGGQHPARQEPIPYLYLPLQVEETLYGYCIVICMESEFAKGQIDQLEQISWIFLLSLREKQQNYLARQRFLDEIIYDILYNNYDSKIALYEKARHLKWDLEGSYAILVIETVTNKIDIVKSAGPQHFNGSPATYTIVDQKAVAILSLTNIATKQVEESLDSFARELLSNLAINHIKEKDIFIGVSSTAKALTDLHQCFQEAKIALELGKVFDLGKINYFEKMGYWKFIFTAPAQELQEFQERILGKIVAHDLEQETDLLDTLRAYIEQQGQIANTAKHLFVHENTLRNRLKKIEQLLNLDLGRIDHLVNIYIALQILTLDAYEI